MLTTTIPPVQAKLEAFLKRNTAATVSHEDKFDVIHNPWGDDTLILKLDESCDSLIDSLNHIYLPPSFSALWHVDTCDLEVIFTALPIHNEAYSSRSFHIHDDGVAYKCEFAASSKRLMDIAGAHIQIAPPSHTNHRNLDSFRSYLRRKKTDEGNKVVKAGIPTSFWIRNIAWDETRIVSLSRHINFYMRYFDRSTPRILVHEAIPADTATPSHIQYPRGPFPSDISIRKLDDYLLGLWHTAIECDTSLRFLYQYQILEYAGFYYFQEDMARSVKRLLTSPDTAFRASEVSRKILDLIAEDKMRDEARIVAVVKQLVDPGTIWNFIEPNRALFSSGATFDGGFSIPPLISDKWSLDDFTASWIPKYPDSLRKIRNALVHSREARVASVIAPTRRNMDMLTPWTTLLGLTCDQIMVFMDNE